MKTSKLILLIHKYLIRKNTEGRIVRKKGVKIDGLKESCDVVEELSI